MRTRVIALTAALLALVAATSRADDKTKPVSDNEFIKEAAEGGQAEVKLGQLALQHASDPAVKKFAQRMIDDHSRANQQFMALLKQKAAAPPALGQEPTGKAKETYDRLARLNGADFDRAYMRAMLDDHEKDVALFQSMSQNGQDADLKGFATKTLPVLKEHLQLARETANKVGAGKDKDR